MITNSKLTIYHKKLDTSTKLETWTRFNYNNVWAFKKSGSNRNKGLENSNSIDVRLSYEYYDLNIDNFSKGDIILPEEVTIDITSPKDLSNYTIYYIRSINNNTFGKRPHIHIKGD